MYISGRDSCKGDSGGPLISTSTNGNTMYLMGLVAFGTTQCATGSPGVYTNVQHYIGWIRQNLRP